MSALKPRPAYCTGCGNTMPKMHLLFIHRGQDRCGGRFLPPEEQRLNRAHKIMKDMGYAVLANDIRIDRDRMRHDRRQNTSVSCIRCGGPHNVWDCPMPRLPSAPRLTNAEAAAERKRVNRIRIGCWRKRHG